MKFLKQSAREKPRVSLILLDWSVRESFHLLQYLSRQDVPREDFEAIVIEYYSRDAEVIRRFEPQVDTWVLLEMPEDCYYHKHLMYNVGIVLARGEICVVCDSDAMVKEGFIRTIAGEFDRERNIVLHLDQFRNMRRDFYPFNFPSFDEVLGEGCINNVGGRTKGVLDTEDPIHTRNYGACMCARREDLIAIGGADEHIDFLGHICGPYDMTFRLVNTGLREIWHQSEFMFHTWHPGQAGVDNYLGPHDGRHVSTTSLGALANRRVMPLLENPAVRRLRNDPGAPRGELLGLLIRPEGAREWRRENVKTSTLHPRIDDGDVHIENYRGFSVYDQMGIYYAHLLIDAHKGRDAASEYGAYVEGKTVEEIRSRIDRKLPRAAILSILFGRIFVLAWQVARYTVRPSKKLVTSALRGLRNAARSLVRAADLVRRRLFQFTSEGRFIGNALADLLPNLYYLSRMRIGGLDPSKLTVLVEDRRTEYCLRILGVAGIIPRVNLVRIGDGKQLTEFFDQLKESAATARLLFARGLYVRYYPIVVSYALGRSAIIV